MSVKMVLNEARHVKSAFCIYENKGVDQLCGIRAADQHLYFRCIDSRSSFFSFFFLYICIYIKRLWLLWRQF